MHVGCTHIACIFVMHIVCIVELHQVRINAISLVLILFSRAVCQVALNEYIRLGVLSCASTVATPG